MWRGEKEGEQNQFSLGFYSSQILASNQSCKAVKFAIILFMLQHLEMVEKLEQVFKSSKLRRLKLLTTDEAKRSSIKEEIETLKALQLSTNLGTTSLMFKNET